MGEREACAVMWAGWMGINKHLRHHRDVRYRLLRCVCVCMCECTKVWVGCVGAWVRGWRGICIAKSTQGVHKEYTKEEKRRKKAYLIQTQFPRSLSNRIEPIRDGTPETNQNRGQGRREMGLGEIDPGANPTLYS